MGGPHKKGSNVEIRLFLCCNHNKLKTVIWLYPSNTLRTKTPHDLLTLCRKTSAIQFHRPYTSVIKYSLRKNGLVKCSVWDLIGQFRAPGQVIWVMPYESMLDERFSWHYFNGSARSLMQQHTRKYFRKVFLSSTEIATESQILNSTEISQASHQQRCRTINFQYWNVSREQLKSRYTCESDCTL